METIHGGFGVAFPANFLIKLKIWKVIYMYETYYIYWYFSYIKRRSRAYVRKGNILIETVLVVITCECVLST